MKKKRLEDTFSHWEELASDPKLEDHSTLGGPSKGDRFVDLKELEQMLSLDLKGSCILDVGAGYGRFAISVATKCKSVVALDISPSMLGRLKKNAQTHMVTQQLDVVRADIRYVPFGKACFDGIVCFATFYYLPKKYWHSILGTFSRTLRSEGWLLISLKHLRNAFRARYGFGLLYFAAYIVLKLESSSSGLILLSRKFGLHGRTEYLVTKRGATKILSTFFSEVSGTGSSYARYVCKRPFD